MVRIFISYAHADEALRQELDKHLTSLKHQGLVQTWHDRRIDPGQEWPHEIDGNLRSADIILLLVSADFISSQYCYEIEVAEAMRRHEAREAVVIPVILRPCKWQGLPFGKLQAATPEGRPVQKYPTLDEGFLDVVQSIEAAAQRIKQRPESARGKAPRQKAESTAVDSGRGAAHGAPRSSNLSVKKSFTDHERDTFRVRAFEYISAFFENSLNELEARNRHLEKHFRSRDANSFEAAVYAEGKVVARCGIWLTSDRHFGELNYSDSGLGNGNSYNESLSVADDGQALGLIALGIGSFAGGTNDKILTLEGAAEYLWSMFIRPLQER